MLIITVEIPEDYDEENNTFIAHPSVKVKMEHSLLSLSKWESKFEKPFLSSSVSPPKTLEEVKEYIRCMVIGIVDDEIIELLLRYHADEINEYIQSPQSATTVYHPPTTTINRQVVTSELIYYWMIAFKVPFECQTWHLNRLLKLIDVCNVQENPKKMSRHEQILRQRALNEQRRATKG